MFDDDDDPDFEFATNADLHRVLRGQPDDPAEAQSAELARWADDGGPAVELE